MKQAVHRAALAAVTIAALSLSVAPVLAQTATGENGGLPGGHPHSDYSKPGNGDHGNNGGNGG